MADLRRAASAAKRAERRLEEEIYRAFIAGNSLRAIAAEVDRSHESVREIVMRMKQWIERESSVLAEPAYAATVDAKMAASVQGRNNANISNGSHVKEPDR